MNNTNDPFRITILSASKFELVLHDPDKLVPGSIRQSIEKHQMMLDFCIENEDMQCARWDALCTCPLCHMYYYNSPDCNYDSLVCIGCPISEHVGKSECRETPYVALENAKTRDKYIAALENEIKFLQMLEKKHDDNNR